MPRFYDPTVFMISCANGLRFPSADTRARHAHKGRKQTKHVGATSASRPLGKTPPRPVYTCTWQDQGDKTITPPPSTKNIYSITLCALAVSNVSSAPPAQARPGDPAPRTSTKPLYPSPAHPALREALPVPKYTNIPSPNYCIKHE